MHNPEHPDVIRCESLGDSTIDAFLTLLDHDIDAGRNVRSLSKTLLQTIQAHAGHNVYLDKDFDEDVEI